MTALTVRRATSLAAALTLAATLTPGVALAENGNVSGNGVTAVQHEALINLDPNARGSLTIDKRQQDATNGTTAGNGLKDATVTGAPLPGVTFTIARLTAYDLTTQKGWEDLAALKGDATAAKATGTGTPTSLTTGADGTATFTDLPLGAYLVTETSAPEGYTPGEPFIATVPMTHPTELNHWNYDPVVYPKNAITTVRKTVKNAKAPAVGDLLTYEIDGDVPILPTGRELDNYQVVDGLDPRLTVDPATVTATMTGTAAATLDPSHYSVATGTSPSGRVYITVTFTKEGRATILAARRAGDTTTKVRVTLPARLAKPVGDDGVIRNDTWLIPSTPSTAWDPHKPSDTPPGPHDDVESKYGRLRVTKTSAADSKARLAGAEFQLYQCSVAGNQATGTPTLRDADPAKDGTQPLTINGATTFTTGEDGTVLIDGIKNNDWTDGAKVVTTEDDWYCLVETKAPQGYALSDKAIPFQVLVTNATVDTAYTVDATVADVPNEPVPTPSGSTPPVKPPFNPLPRTGAEALRFLAIAGGLLVVGSGILIVLRRRKDDEDTEGTEGADTRA